MPVDFKVLNKYPPLHYEIYNYAPSSSSFLFTNALITCLVLARIRSSYSSKAFNACKNWHS